MFSGSAGAQGAAEASNACTTASARNTPASGWKSAGTPLGTVIGQRLPTWLPASSSKSTPQAESAICCPSTAPMSSEPVSVSSGLSGLGLECPEWQHLLSTPHPEPLGVREAEDARAAVARGAVVADPSALQHDHFATELNDRPSRGQGP